MSVWSPSRSGDPEPDAFRRMAEEAYARIPEAFRTLTADLVIRTPDLPTEDVLAELGIEDPYGLLGLYHGIDLTRKSLFDVSGEPDTVFLYRLPILRFWREGTDSLEEIVEHVLVHEIGHHFGFSDEDMEAIESSED
ncbi:metallopeptidase family protein [Parvularcula lutaonensis]|uniref:Metallopeptidase family protein n=1 Tax=Parvularcula lutaonensis TaxID=491923 RepID=A0ABV7MCC5_9PROT|nr:metallopeptidase family protein [Parvularcula lutaonensis]GGY38171.1 hypothetical protein GCM10007148_03070 [Parvularcula lutaonensis]